MSRHLSFKPLFTTLYCIHGCSLTEAWLSALGDHMQLLSLAFKARKMTFSNQKSKKKKIIEFYVFLHLIIIALFKNEHSKFIISNNVNNRLLVSESKQFTYTDLV